MWVSRERIGKSPKRTGRRNTSFFKKTTHSNRRGKRVVGRVEEKREKRHKEKKFGKRGFG